MQSIPNQRKKDTLLANDVPFRHITNGNVEPRKQMAEERKQKPKEPTDLLSFEQSLTTTVEEFAEAPDLPLWFL